MTKSFTEGSVWATKYILPSKFFVDNLPTANCLLPTFVIKAHNSSTCIDSWVTPF